MNRVGILSTQILDDIANAIRLKRGEGTSVKYFPAEMPSAILGIETGSSQQLQEKTIQSAINTQTVYPDAGYDGMTRITVNGIQVVRVSNSAGGVTVSIG